MSNETEKMEQTQSPEARIEELEDDLADCQCALKKSNELISLYRAATMRISQSITLATTRMKDCEEKASGISEAIQRAFSNSDWAVSGTAGLALSTQEAREDLHDCHMATFNGLTEYIEGLSDDPNAVVEEVAPETFVFLKGDEE